MCAYKCISEVATRIMICWCLSILSSAVRELAQQHGRLSLDRVVHSGVHCHGNDEFSSPFELTSSDRIFSGSKDEKLRCLDTRNTGVLIHQHRISYYSRIIFLCRANLPMWGYAPCKPVGIIKELLLTDLFCTCVEFAEPVCFYSDSSCIRLQWFHWERSKELFALCLICCLSNAWELLWREICTAVPMAAMHTTPRLLRHYLPISDSQVHPWELPL